MKSKYIPAVVIGAIVIIGMVTFAVREGGMPLNSATDETSDTRDIVVGDVPVEVWVADMPDQQRRGLSGVSEMAENQGMLFVFDTSDTYGIWMKDMAFPIDVFWLSAGGVIVDLEEHVEPETYPDVFTPRTSAQYVLELQAGFAETHDISVGDRVEL